MKRFFLGILIIIVFLCVLIIVFATTNTGLRTALNIISWSSSAKFSATKIKGSLTNGNIYLENVHYQNKANHVSIGNLTLIWTPTQLFSGRFYASKLIINKVRIRHTSSTSTPTDDSHNSFSLPMAITIKQAHISKINYRTDNSKATRIQSLDFSLNSKENTLYIKQFSIKSKPNSLTLTGNVNLSSPYQTHLKGSFLNKGKLFKQLAATFAISGNIKETLNAHITATDPVELNIQAKLNKPLANGSIDVHGNWNQIAFALSNRNYIQSDNGTIDIHGHPSHYQISLNSDLSGKQLPKSFIKLKGQGNTKQLQLENFSIRIEKSVLSTSGLIQWKPHLYWRLKVKGTNFNPNAIWPRIYANLNFAINTSGQYGEQKLSTETTLNQLTGTYNNKPITGNADIYSLNKDISIKQFIVKLGRNNININGHIGKNNTLNWTLNVPKLHDFYPDFSGSIISTGELQGSFKRPVIRTQATVKRLSSPIIRIKSLQMHGLINSDIHQPSHFHLKAEKLLYQGFKILHAYFYINGDANQHDAKLQVNARNENLTIKTHGFYKNKTLKETISTLSLKSQKFKDWTLSKPFQVIFNRKLLHVTPFCWQSDAKHFICGKSNYDIKQQWYTQINVKHFNLGLFNVFLPSQWRVESDIDSNLRIHGNGKKAPTGLFDTYLHSLKITQRSRQNTNNHLLLINSHINLTADKKGLHNQSTLHFYNQDNISQLRLSLPDYKLFARIRRKQKINGQLKLSLKNLNQFSKLSPYISSISGILQGNIHLTGTIRKPKLNGKIALDNGVITNSQYGVVLKNIKLHLNANAEKIRIQSSLQSGKGTLNMQAESSIINPMKDLKATIIGSNLLIANTKEYHIEITPNLHINYTQPTLTVSGNIDIPVAIIKPKDFTSVVTLPNNFVVISRKNPPRSRAMQLVLNVTTRLGKHVSFKYAGLKAKLGGEITINSQPKTITTAIGKLYVIKGAYKAYGQELKIKRGLIIFTGGDVANPGLDILAAKVIPVYNFSGVSQASTDQKIIVGMLITGTVNNPKITLYSQPPMSQTDILSYLLFNKPSNATGGADAAILTQAASFLSSGHTTNFTQDLEKKLGLSTLGLEASQVFVPGETGPQSTTSFVVGKQITKRLSAIYSVGLSIPISILMLRYQLSKHWQLQSQTSNYDNGADIVYTIESG